MMYGSWGMNCNMQLQLHHFEPFVALLIHKQPKKLKFWKNEKNCLEISSFYSSVPNIKTRPCMVPEIWWATDRQTDRWTDEQEKWHTEVAAHLKKWQTEVSAPHKETTHMWRTWGTTQNFFLAFTDKLEKQILKKVLKWANKKQNYFNIYNAACFKKYEKTPEISLFYTCLSKISMTWPTVPEI